MQGRIRRSVFGRYAVAWLYLAAVCAAEITYALLSPTDRAAMLRSASTSVYNLEHDPVGTLIASAFFTQGYLLAWPVLIALALFGANHALGNWRTAVTCGAAHLIGTLSARALPAIACPTGCSRPLTGT
jgi:hypothetical protein